MRRMGYSYQMHRIARYIGPGLQRSHEEVPMRRMGTRVWRRMGTWLGLRRDIRLGLRGHQKIRRNDKGRQ